MIELGTILTWLKYRRAQKKRELEIRLHEELFYKTVTIHGRLELSDQMRNEEELPSHIRRMYYCLLRDAPLKEWSVWN